MTTCYVCGSVLPFSEQKTLIPVCTERCLRIHLHEENEKYLRVHDPKKFLVTHEPFGLPTPASRSGGKLSESFLPSPVKPKPTGMFNQ